MDDDSIEDPAYVWKTYGIDVLYECGKCLLMIILAYPLMVSRSFCVTNVQYSNPAMLLYPEEALQNLLTNLLICKIIV